MDSRARPAIGGRMEETDVGVWGVGAWTTDRKWGASDSRCDPLTVDRYDGTAHWGQQCWVTDGWTRW